jgi:Amidohydrolase
MQMRHKRFAISVLVTIVALLAIGGGIFIFGSRTAPVTPEPSAGTPGASGDAQAEPLPTQSPASAVRFEGRFIDVHAHIGPKGMPLEEIVQNMDREGIDTMIVMMTPTAIAQGMPPSDSGIPDAAEQYPGRFISLYGGEAITLLDAVVARGSFTKAEQKQYVALLEEAMQSGKYSGFGEIALRHVLPKPGEGADVTVPGDHPWLLIMSDIAAKYDVPIDIHMDIEAGANGIAGLEKLLEHNRETKIIWSHTAWSRTDYQSFSIEELRRLLETHPNLYSSIKIQTETAFMGQDKKIKPEWMTLFEDYSGRFMVGTDIKPGLVDGEFKFVKAHRKFLEQLPPEILKAFERDNAIEVFRIG